ncbi:hypothetical protein RQP46_005695 [Phenoliferia psychrophenolica]
MLDALRRPTRATPSLAIASPFSPSVQQHGRLFRIINMLPQAGSVTLAALLLSSLIPVDAGSAVLRGRRSAGQRQLYKREDGVFRKDFVEGELNRLASKFSVVKKPAGVALLQPASSAGLHHSNWWVPGMLSTCQSQSFMSAASSSYVNTLLPFKIQYGSGAVIGTLASDDVWVAGLKVSNQYFGDGALDLNLFGFYLARDQVSGSTLTLGAVDPAHFIGGISYTPVTTEGYWQVAATDSLVNGVVVPGTSFGAAIDTGTSLIYVPKAVAAALYAAVPGSVVDTADSFGGDLTYFTVPCESNTTFALTFAGIEGSFPINFLNFNLGKTSANSTSCVGGVIGQDFDDAAGLPLAIVGDEMSPALN